MSKTVIYIHWKLTDRIEVFVNLGKLFNNYTSDDLGISRWTLDRKDLYEGFENDYLIIKKVIIR